MSEDFESFATTDFVAVDGILLAVGSVQSCTINQSINQPINQWLFYFILQPKA